MLQTHCRGQGFAGIDLGGQFMARVVLQTERPRRVGYTGRKARNVAGIRPCGECGPEMELKMDLPVHGFSDLFDQLGLPASDDAIRQFLARHSPLPDQITLADAAFWSDSQAAFLREQIAADADWAEVVDQLNAALRAAS